MKRTLLEIFGGLAVLVILVSLNNQVARLKVRENEVAELKTLVRDAVTSTNSKDELATIRAAILSEIESKILGLEQQVAQARFSTREAEDLRRQLGETRREAALAKAQLELDITRTRETVDAYHEELRTERTSGMAKLRQTQADIALLAGALHRDPEVLSRELLSPAVQLNGDDTVGSGTLIFSGQSPKSKQNETYVITSYHVVRNILADTPRARTDGIAVTVYENKTKHEFKCDMVAHEKRIDAALLKLRTERTFNNIARVMPREDSDRIKVWDPIYAVGCPLGNDPIPTQGEVSSLQNELNGANYWMINAPTYFGNSGGGVFTAHSRELIGVFSKIYTHGRGNPVVIPHMGLFTPLPLIYHWLEKEQLGFVLQNGLPRRDPDHRLQLLASPAAAPR